MSRVIVFVVAILILLGGSFFGVRFLLSQQKGKAAGLKVTSVPTASVFLDSKNIGRTPYEDKLEPGEYTLKLIPEITAGETLSWQGRIILSPNLLTYVNRELGTSELKSAGEILTLEKIDERQAEIAVTVTPEGATVQLDGVERGTAPLLLRNIEPGDHELSITAPGFDGRSIKVRATAGFKLSADVQLALSKGESPEATGGAKPGEAEKGEKEGKEPAKPYVKILDTPTGWLRVRSEPTTASTESAKVNPGETFALLDEQSGWYKIEYKEDKQGWVSSRYAEKVE